MRTFAILLFVLNLIFLAWNQGFLGGKEPDAAVVRSPVRQAPQRLRLISETITTEAVSVSGEAELVEGLFSDDEQLPIGLSPALEASLPVVVLSPAYCMSFGVFVADADTDRFVMEMLAQGYQASAEVVEIDDAPGFWVHIPPMVSQTDRNIMLAELEAFNLEAYIIEGGVLDGGISLGLFGLLAPAETFEEELERLGFSIEVMQIPRTVREKWVSVEGMVSNDLPVSQWLAILENWPELKQEEKLCETIAPRP